MSDLCFIIYFVGIRTRKGRRSTRRRKRRKSVSTTDTRRQGTRRGQGEMRLNLKKKYLTRRRKSKLQARLSMCSLRMIILFCRDDRRARRRRDRHHSRHDRHDRSSRQRNEEEVVEEISSEEEDAANTDRDGGSTPELPEETEEVVLEKEAPKKSSGSDRREYEQWQERERERAHRRDREREGDRHRESDRRDRERDRTREPVEERSSRRRAPEPERRSARQQDRSRSPPRKSKSQEPAEEPPAPEVGTLPDKGGTKETVSLSIAETNKLRASLGLAPLRINKEEKKSKDEQEKLEEKAEAAGGTLIPGSRNNEIHVPAGNLKEKSLAEKLRERIALRKKKREQEMKLLKVKKLGESDSEDDGKASNWIEKQKRAAKEKAAAEKRAKMLEDLDDQFGVNSLVKEDTAQDKNRQYGRNNLSGLKVEHSAESFQSGQSMILTLKDADILDNEATDTLVNVNKVDDEKAKKKIDDAKKSKTGYNAYDDEEIDPLTGEVRKKTMLNKYDEEIDGHKKDTFTIGSGGDYNEEEQIKKRKEEIKAKLAAKNVISLESAPLKIASDYYTAEEAAAKFKKPKKKKKVKRRMLKADDLVPLDEGGHFGSRSGKGKKSGIAGSSGNRGGELPMDIDEEDGQPGAGNNFDLSRVKVEEEEEDLGLELALKKARRLKQRSNMRTNDPADLIKADMPEIKTENDDDAVDMGHGSEFISTFEDLPAAQQTESKELILNETAEFCRNLGARQFNEFAEMKMKAEAKVC